MLSRSELTLLRLCIAVLVYVSLTGVSLLAQSSKPVSIPEEIEWTWEVRPPHPDQALPNVLLLGDSITRNYFPSHGGNRRIVRS